ncbi:hypothetical protein IP81_19490 [Novosphingobium sp. AAP83]|nr:hypothetical protein IP81_19490 [Novosphingobium sp. AAP83]
MVPEDRHALHRGPNEQRDDFEFGLGQIGAHFGDGAQNPRARSNTKFLHAFMHAKAVYRSRGGVCEHECDAPATRKF